MSEGQGAWDLAMQIWTHPRAEWRVRLRRLFSPGFLAWAKRAEWPQGSRLASKSLRVLESPE